MTEQDFKNMLIHYIGDDTAENIKDIEKIMKAYRQFLIDARIEGAIRMIVRLTILMSDGTSTEEYQKALSILHKQKIMLREELKKEEK